MEIEITKLKVEIENEKRKINCKIKCITSELTIFNHIKKTYGDARRSTIITKEES